MKISATAKGRSTAHHCSAPVRLVVNADDYGYYRCVSAGIRAGIEAGVITATGMMTTSTLFSTEASLLRNMPRVDCGVHLNLTWGQPATPAMTRLLWRSAGLFPGRTRAAVAIMLGQWNLDVIRGEWAAQIELALAMNLPIQFLNSHEHIHLLPHLRELIAALARDYAIPYVRDLDSEWGWSSFGSGWTRGFIVRMIDVFAPALPSQTAVKCVGLRHSGQLSLTHLRALFRKFRPGGLYELMCHPGYLNPAEVTHPQLIAYHDWEGELAVLLSEDFRHLCDEHCIVLSRFGELTSQ